MDSSLVLMEKMYLERLGRFFPTKVDYVSERRKTDRHQLKTRLQEEVALLEKKISQGYLVVMDESGKEYTSVGLARAMENLMTSGIARITFVSGGHQGLPESFKQRANLLWSMSRLTFPHELARIILLEQVYRAMTIIRNLPYHK